MSPLAIIVAAIFWTWLWGPLGLILSTPLTVCLVVLGRHVPQFEFFEVLFGNEPVLEPKERLYQRLLAGDPEEATDHAEETLEEEYLVDFYQDVAIPALLIGEQDRARGVMAEDQRRRVAASALTLVANLEGIAEDEASEEDEQDRDGRHDPESTMIRSRRRKRTSDRDLPDGSRQISPLRWWTWRTRRRRCRDVGAGVGRSGRGRTRRQVLPTWRQGGWPILARTELHAIVVSFLNANSLKHARFLVRRLKRARPASRIGIVFWSAPGAEKLDGETADALARDLNADFVAFGMTDAVLGALSDDPPVPVKAAAKRLARRPAGVRKRPATTPA